MMISERHKTLNLAAIFCCWLCVALYAASPAPCAADEVFEVLPQSAAEAAATAAKTGKTGSQQDEVNGLAFVTPNVTTAPRLDPNNNNEWRPLGHGDPLQKDPTYDYSPPALERVRYWAENNGSGQEARQKLPAELLRNKTKNEVLLLGVAGERTRPTQQQQQLHQQKPSLGKYPIRRSYYAPQQQQMQQQIQQQMQMQIQQQQLQHMPHTHLMPPPMMMKGMGHVEYRHNVVNSPSSSSFVSYSSPSSSSYSSPSSNHFSSPSKQSSSSHYYSSPSGATAPWFTHSQPSSSLSNMAVTMPHRMSYADAHLQESMQHYSFSRPQSVSYAPNSIHPHSTGNKLSAAAPLRKPWLHELLQKELVKPTLKQRMKPTMPATKFLMGTTKPQLAATHAPFTYAPVTFVPGPPTIATPTVSSSPAEVYITPTILMPTATSGFRPMYSSSSTTTTTALPVYQHPTRTSTSSTTSTTSSSRLMIPQMSNLAQRPTVAPAPELTTDALFSHYKQPPKPLMGPMYLIIEGHSKVKTYGQNELDPHSPKIVPVISKREPVVRVADPNEKRGTVESYQVKHLHTKTMPLTTTTTSTTTTTTKTPSTVKTTTTTARPTTTTSTTSTTSTTARPSLSVTAGSLELASPSTKAPPSGVHDLLSLLDNMFADAQDMVATSSQATPTKSSGSSTVLKPLTMKTKLQPQQEPEPEPRIGSQAGSIVSLLETEDADEQEVRNGSQFATSTEPEQPPRATRQIFDYDQLPESRIKAEAKDEPDAAEDDDDGDDGDDDEAGELLEDGELDNLDDVSEEEMSDTEHNLLKRIDKFVDDVDDGDDDLEGLIDEDDDVEAAADDEDDNEDDDDEQRAKQSRQQTYH